MDHVQKQADDTPSRATDVETAHHEAGHAVAALVLGLSLGEVSIVPSADELGYAYVANPLTHWRRGDGPRRPLLDAYLVSLYAGREAERLALMTNLVGWADDYNKASHWLVTTCGVPGSSFVGDEVQAAYERSLQARARQLIAANLTAVRTLAQALLSAKSLPGHEVEAIVLPMLGLRAEAISEGGRP